MNCASQQAGRASSLTARDRTRAGSRHAECPRRGPTICERSFVKRRNLTFGSAATSSAPKAPGVSTFFPHTRRSGWWGRRFRLPGAEGAIIGPVICTGRWCPQPHCISPAGVPVGVILDLEAVSETFKRGELPNGRPSGRDRQSLRRCSRVIYRGFAPDRSFVRAARHSSGARFDASHKATSGKCQNSNQRYARFLVIIVPLHSVAYGEG